MNDQFKTEYQGTDRAKSFISKYNRWVLVQAVGVFIIIASIIPYLLITSETINSRLIPSLIVAVIGLIIIFIANYEKAKAIEANNIKYTVAAMDFVADEKQVTKKLVSKDIIIGVLLIILLPIIYFLIHYRADFIPENVSRYISAVLVLLLAVAVFLIVNSHGRKNAYKHFIY